MNKFLRLPQSFLAAARQEPNYKILCNTQSQDCEYWKLWLRGHPKLRFYTNFRVQGRVQCPFLAFYIQKIC